MEPAILGVILDSSVLIEAERQHFNVAQFLQHVISTIGERQTGLCSIAVAELAHGIHRSHTVERRVRRRQFLDELKAAMPVYPIGERTAELVGQIGAEACSTGVTIPFEDLLIAGCALERGYGVATRNVRHFRDIPGLHVVAI